MFDIRSMMKNSREIVGDEASQLRAVKQDGCAIQYIHSPSENVQLEAVKQDGCAIQWIHSPSENVMQAALAQDPLCIKYFKRAWLANLKNAKKLTVSEIEELLGYKVEVVAERV